MKSSVRHGAKEKFVILRCFEIVIAKGNSLVAFITSLYFKIRNAQGANQSSLFGLACHIAKILNLWQCWSQGIVFLDGGERAEDDVILNFVKRAQKLLSDVAWTHCIKLHGTIFGVLVGARVIFDVYL